MPSSEAAVSALIGALRDRDAEFRLTVIRSLGQVRPPTEATVSAVVALLNGWRYDVRFRAADAIADMLISARGSCIAAPAFGRHATSGSWPVTITLFESAVPALNAALSSRSRYLRMRAALALSWFGPESAVAVQADAKSSSGKQPHELGNEAAGSLGLIRTAAAAAAPVLIDALNKDWIFWNEVEAAIWRIGPAAIPSLIGALESRGAPGCGTCSWGRFKRSNGCRAADPAPDRRRW